MHIKVDPDRLVHIGIMALRDEQEKRREIGVAVKGLDTFKYVPCPYFEGLIRDHDLIALEAGTCRWELLVDELIKFT